MILFYDFHMNIKAIQWRNYIRFLHLILLIPISLSYASDDLADILAGEETLVDIALDIIFYTGIAGVYAFVFKVKAFHPYFWRCILFLDFTNYVYEIYSGLIHYASSQFNSFESLLNIAGLLFFAFYYYTLLWLYAFHSPDIWQTEKN